MDFQRLKLVNFRNHTHTELDLTPTDLWIIRGRNSAGKSTLACDAITYALFGDLKAMNEPNDMRIKKDEIVSKGKSKTVVEIEFDYRQDTYMIRRTRKLSASSATETVTIRKNGEVEMDEEKQTEAEKWISHNFYSYNDFVNTSMILQNEMTSALEMTRGDREDYLERLFGINKFSEMAELARDKRKQIENRQKVKKETIKVKSGNLVDEEELSSQLKAYEEAKDKAENNFNVVKQDLEQAKEKLETKQEVQQKHNKLKESFKELQNLSTELSEEIKTEIKPRIDKISTALEQKDKLEEQLQKIEELEELVEQRKKLQKNLEKAQSKQKKWKKEISKQKKDLEHKINASDKEIKKIEGRISDLQEEIDDLKAKQAQITTDEEDLQELPEAKKKYEALEAQQKRFNKLDKEHSLAKKDLTNKLEQKEKEITKQRKQVATLDDLRQQLAKKEQAQKKIPAIQKQIVSTEKQKKEKQKKLSQLDNEQGELRGTINSLENQVEQFHEEKQNISDISGAATCPKCKQDLTESHITKILENIAEKLSTINEEIEAKEHKIITLEEEKKEIGKTMTDLDDKLSELREDKNSYTEQASGKDKLETQIEELEKIQQELQVFDTEGGLDSQFQKLREKVNQLAEDKTAAKVDPEELETAKTRYEELKEIQSRVQLLKEQVKKLPDKRENLEAERENKQEMQKQKQRVQTTLDEENFALSAREELETATTRIEEITERLTETKNIPSQLEKLEPEGTRERLEQLAQFDKELIELETKQNEKQNQLEDTKKEKDEVKEQLDQDKFTEIDQQVTDQEKIVSELETKKSEKQDANTHAKRDLKDHKKLMEEQQDLRNKLESFQQQIDDMTQQIDDYKELNRIFQKIGGRIMQRLRNDINRVTADILNMLGNEKLRGVLLTKDFGIEVQTRDNAVHTPGYFSGGQRVRIGFAFRLALSRVLADFKNNELETLIIDEGGFGALDLAGQQGVVDVFREVRGQFKRMIIISHITSITEELPGETVMVEDGMIV